MEPTIYKPSIYKGAGIYKIGGEGGGGGGGGDLPEGYEKRMYINSTDNGPCAISFFSFGRIFYFSDKFEFIFSPGDIITDGTDADIEVFTRNQNIAWRSFSIRNFKNEWMEAKFSSRYDTSVVDLKYYDTSKRNFGMPEIFKIENNADVLKLVVNNVSYTLYSYSTYGGEDPLYYFQLFYSDAQKAPNTKFYSLKIYEGNTDKLKFNGVPCVRLSDNVPGVFDIVSNQFFTCSITSNLGVSPI